MSQPEAAWPPWLSRGGPPAPRDAAACDESAPPTTTQLPLRTAAQPGGAGVSDHVCTGCAQAAPAPLRLRCEACRRAYFCSRACAEGGGAARHALSGCAFVEEAAPTHAPPADHLPVALLLASFSDAAYAPPADALRDAAAGAVRTAGANGCELHCAPALANRCFAGRLRLRLLDATAVPRHAKLVAECGDAEAACAVRHFAERSSFAIELPLRLGVDTLRLRLRAGACLPPFACGLGPQGASLGIAEVRLPALHHGESYNLTARLHGAGGGGQLRLKLRLLPLATSPRAAAAHAARAAAPVPPHAVLPVELSLYEPLSFVSHARTHTQAALWRSRRGCTVIVAFRGTEPGCARDLATDLQLSNAHVPAARFAFADGAAEPLAQARVHAGFAAAYASVRRVVRAALDAALRGHDSDQAGPATRLLITGHSLGGALATLCAADVAETWAAANVPASRRPLLLVHTFGSPRAGDSLFVSRFAELVPHALRFVAGQDLVPSLPPAAMGFAHAGAGVQLPHADADEEVAATELPGADHEREPADIAAALLSGLGLKHHSVSHYTAALHREHKRHTRTHGKGHEHA